MDTTTQRKPTPSLCRWTRAKREDNVEIRNAKITSTFLGFNHGCLTFWLNLDYGGSGQSAGGYVLDTYDKGKGGRIGHACGSGIIGKILEIIEVESWEELPGIHIRVKATHGGVSEIANVLKDNWLNFSEFFKAYDSGHNG